jgi:hypothetical protein
LRECKIFHFCVNRDLFFKLHENKTQKKDCDLIYLKICFCDCVDDSLS